MKKIQLMLVGVLGLTASGLSSAVEVMGAGGATLTILACPQLANDTRVVLSANVRGAYDCDTDAVIVGISACHATGLTAGRSADVAPTAPPAGSPVGTPPTCTAPLTLTGQAPNERCTGTVEGATFPTATTGQGTVISAFPGQDCDEAGANVSSVVEAAVAAAAAD
jgi:hypothetical protein